MAKLNVANRTAFLSDNLPILQGINSNSVDCVYLDPPFNRKKPFVDPTKGGDKHIQFDDTWRTPTSAEDLAALEADVREAGQASDLLRELLDAAKHDDDRHNQNYNYLAMMAARLVECRRILKPTGSLFLHCDDTMSHWLKLLLDAIFGGKNFVNEILWCYSTASTPNIKQFPRCNDKILCYSKDKKKRKFRGDNVRVPYKGGGLMVELSG